MTRSYRRAAVATLACVGLAAAATGTTLAIPAHAAPAPVTSVRPVKADFNSDGYADLAVGVPLEDIGAAADAGSVQVFYGAADGLDPASSRVFRQGANGVIDTPESGDRFGAAVAIGNFNGDAYADLAIGVPLEDLGTIKDAGAVEILYGSAGGLNASGSQFLNQAAPGSVNAAEAGDRFGSSLAAGDIAGGSQADLAVGVPLEDVSSAKDAGAVHVLRGSASGLTVAGNQLLSQNSAGAGDKSETGDHFGTALAIGNMGASSKRDLVVGIPLENVGKVVDAGAVHFFPGSTGAVSTGADKVITQNSKGIADKAEKGDRFGAALAAADLAGTTKVDVAVGIPYENVGKVADAGAIALLRGATAGLSTGSDQLISQNSTSAVDKAEKGDHYGAALAAADMSGTSKADLAVGVPLENFNGKTDAGAVHLIPGGTKGLSLSKDQLLQQDRAGSEAAVESKDHFGAALASANLVGSSLADLVVGVPYENVGPAADGGSVQIFRGAAAGVTISRDQVVTQGDPVSFAEDGDRFATSLAAG